MGSYCIAQAGLEVTVILLPQLPEHGDKKARAISLRLQDDLDFPRNTAGPSNTQPPFCPFGEVFSVSVGRRQVPCLIGGDTEDPLPPTLTPSGDSSEESGGREHSAHTAIFRPLGCVCVCVCVCVWVGEVSVCLLPLSVSECCDCRI